jgi:hypothetical protein
VLRSCQALNSSIATDGVLQGVLFWLWDARNEGSTLRTTDQGITSTDSTWCASPYLEITRPARPANAALRTWKLLDLPVLQMLHADLCDLEDGVLRQAYRAVPRAGARMTLVFIIS